MSIKSTRCLTREEIIDHIMQREAQLKRFDAYTDEELENMAEDLDEACGDKFTNYVVITPKQADSTYRYSR